MRPIPTAISRTIRIALIALAGMMATNGFAFDASDPFATDAITPLPPQIAPVPESSFIPCQPMLEDTVYGVIEVVDRALCQNPRTREAWANARIQAAQVGVAQADFLPDLDGRIGASRTSGSADTTTLAKTKPHSVE